MEKNTREARRPPLGTQQPCPQCDGRITLRASLKNNVAGEIIVALPDRSASRREWQCEHDSTHNFYDEDASLETA